LADRAAVLNISQTINTARQEGNNKSGRAAETPDARSDTPSGFDSRDEVLSAGNAVELFRILASAFHNTARLILLVTGHSLDDHRGRLLVLRRVLRGILRRILRLVLRRILGLLILRLGLLLLLLIRIAVVNGRIVLLLLLLRRSHLRISLVVLGSKVVGLSDEVFIVVTSVFHDFRRERLRLNVLKSFYINK